MKLSEAGDDVLVDKYIELRDSLAQEEAAYKERIADRKGKMDKIEVEFLRRLNERGSESVRTKAGTAYKNVKTSVSIADWDAFFHRFVLPQQAWDLINHAANKTAVIQFRGEHNDIPPGLNLREEVTVGFRRS